MKMNRKFKVGDRVRILNGRNSGSNLTIGSVQTIDNIKDDRVFFKDSSSFSYPEEIEFVPTTKEELLEEMGSHAQKMSETKSKIDFLNETGLSEFDDQEYKIFRSLKVIGINDIEKVRELIKILES